MTSPKNEIDRLTRIAVKTAGRHEATAAVYASHCSFDILTERWQRNKDGKRVYGGMHWMKLPTRNCYLTPAAVARSIRAEIREVWGR